MRLTRDDALFLDFDGTLTRIQDDASTVRMSAEMEAAVLRADKLTGGALTLISGRDLDDLASRSPASLKRIGNHGLRASGMGASGMEGRGMEWPDLAGGVPEGLAAGMETFAGNGVWLETKGPVLALHYRDAPEQGGSLDRLARDLVANFPAYSVEHGKCVIEAKPDAASKGGAVRRAMKMEPFAGRRPVMIGDDTTDEAGFAAAQALGGHGVKVGGGPTCAHWRVADVGDVLGLLLKIRANT